MKQTQPCPPRDAGETDADLTPMIDVTFQLIVFLLVANDLSHKQVEELELPLSASLVEDVGGQTIVINVPRPRGDAPPTTVRVLGRDLTFAEVERAVRAAAEREEGAVRVLLRADTGTPWRHVQLALQSCARSGVDIERVEIGTRRRP